MRDLVLFPHCDIHVALHGAPALSLSVFTREPASPTPDHLELTNVTTACSWDLFAPHNPNGSRFEEFVTIAPNGTVTPNKVGTNLVQVRHGNHYIVARIQVHDTILGWWFGNGSITTARDAQFATSQPSIYALFSDDASGTDLVGDITGHGYVPLTSKNPAIFNVAMNGRLQGVAEGSGTLEGDFLGVKRTLPVRTVDYAKTRNELEPVRAPALAKASAVHNMLFVGEGFRDTADDRALFDKVVTKAVDQLFTSERHQPYGLLEGSFNVFKAYAPSQQNGATVASRVNTGAATGGNPAEGSPIPFEGAVSDSPKYTVQALVRKVGLPKRKETRAAAPLIAAWSSQTLTDFDAARVDEATVNAWKTQTADGLLEARDTFFGMQYGYRFADRRSGFSATPVPRPATETAGDPALRAFIARVYEWFELWVSRVITPDPRRQAPERLRRTPSDLHRDTVTSWYAGLNYKYAPNQNLGAEWVPHSAPATTLRPSVGLVGIIVNDAIHGGASLGYATTNSLNSAKLVGFTLAPSGTERTMRRTIPDEVDADIQACIDTLAHEFGHALGLGDEYEDYPGDDPDLVKNADVDVTDDNLARLAAVYAHGTKNPDGTVTLADRTFDPDKIKWLDLLRPQLSAQTIAPSVQAGANLEVKIHPRYAARWKAAKAANLEAFLRARDITPEGRQLPLKHDDAHYLVRLTIERVDEANGTIALGGPELPPSPFPVFPVNSLLFIPRRHEDGSLRYVVEKKVRQKLDATHEPLNQDRDTAKVNKDPDSPVSIDGFKGPCKSYKTIGVYEGGGYYAAGKYRPTGHCKMRSSKDIDGPGEGEFCFVCRYLLVSRIDPGLLDVLDNAQYPGAKKGDA